MPTTMNPPPVTQLPAMPAVLAADDPRLPDAVERSRHITCALWRERGAPLDYLARFFGVSPRTVERWLKAAPTYPDKEADPLRSPD